MTRLEGEVHKSIKSEKKQIKTKQTKIKLNKL